MVPHSLGSSRNSLCSCPCPALGSGLWVEPCSSRVQRALSLASHPARPGRRWPPAVPMVRAALLVASDLTQSQTTLGAGRCYVPMLPGVRGHRPRTRGAQAAPRADPVLATSPLAAGTGEPGALPEAGEALSRARPRPALCLCPLGQGRHLRPPAHGSSSTRGPPRTPAGLTDRRVALRTSPCGGEGQGRAQPWVPWVCGKASATPLACSAVGVAPRASELGDSTCVCTLAPPLPRARCPPHSTRWVPAPRGTPRPAARCPFAKTGASPGRGSRPGRSTAVLAPPGLPPGTGPPGGPGSLGSRSQSWGGHCKSSSPPSVAPEGGGAGALGLHPPRAGGSCALPTAGVRAGVRAGILPPSAVHPSPPPGPTHTCSLFGGLGEGLCPVSLRLVEKQGTVWEGPRLRVRGPQESQGRSRPTTTPGAQPPTSSVRPVPAAGAGYHALGRCRSLSPARLLVKHSSDSPLRPRAGAWLTGAAGSEKSGRGPAASPSREPRAWSPGQGYLGAWVTGWTGRGELTPGGYSLLQASREELWSERGGRVSGEGVSRPGGGTATRSPHSLPSRACSLPSSAHKGRGLCFLPDAPSACAHLSSAFLMQVPPPPLSLNRGHLAPGGMHSRARGPDIPPGSSPLPVWPQPHPRGPWLL